jgi:hypothetical protein
MARGLRAAVAVPLLALGLVACQPKSSGVTTTPTTTTVAEQPVPTVPVTVAPVTTTVPVAAPVATTPITAYVPPTTLYVPPVTTASTVPGNGAMALCNDGTLSYSATHRGTCSHHGGVRTWYR